MRLSLLILTVIVLVFSCKKDDLAPDITLDSPTDGQIFHDGDVVTVSGTAHDASSIHMFHLMVTDNNGNALIHDEEHLDEGTHPFTKQFTVHAAHSYLVVVEAEDHSGNTSRKEVNVNVP